MREPTPRDPAGVLQPILIGAAGDCYQIYLQDLERTGQSSTARPLGVVVDRVSHRARTIVRPQPLLPQERFIPLNLIAPIDG